MINKPYTFACYAIGLLYVINGIFCLVFNGAIFLVGLLVLSALGIQTAAHAHAHGEFIILDRQRDE